MLVALYKTQTHCAAPPLSCSYIINGIIIITIIIISLLPVSRQAQEVLCGVTFDINACAGTQEGEQLRSLGVAQHLLTVSEQQK